MADGAVAFENWPDFVSVVASVYGWSHETFLRMTFHELVMLWYPRALAERRARSDAIVYGVIAGIAKGFSGGRR